MKPLLPCFPAARPPATKSVFCLLDLPILDVSDTWIQATCDFL